MKRLGVSLVLVGSCFATWAQTGSTANDSPGISDFPNYHPLIVHFPLVFGIAAGSRYFADCHSIYGSSRQKL